MLYVHYCRWFIFLFVLCHFFILLLVVYIYSLKASDPLPLLSAVTSLAGVDRYSIRPQQDADTLHYTLYSLYPTVPLHSQCAMRDQQVYHGKVSNYIQLVQLVLIRLYNIDRQNNKIVFH